jgi:hypothetical protein
VTPLFLDWVALALAGLVYAGFCFGAYRTGGLHGAVLGLAITGVFLWAALTV